MKLQAVLIYLTILASALVSANIGETSYYGQITTLEDCEKFNQIPEFQMARATVTATGAGRSRGTWRIEGPGKKFLVEDCFKKIVEPNKNIMFTVTKDFEKLKVFPKGPGLLQVNVGVGPNGPADAPEPVPTFLDDESFNGVYFGLAESETGGAAAYTKEHIDLLMKMHDMAEVRAERFVLLNSGLVQRADSKVFSAIAGSTTASVVLYQEKSADVDPKALAGRLGSEDVNFLFPVVGIENYLAQAWRADTPPASSSSSTEEITTEHHTVPTEAPPDTEHTEAPAEHTGTPAHSGVSALAGTVSMALLGLSFYFL